MDKEIKTEFESLARMVKGEFDNVHGEIQDLRREMDARFDNLEQEIHQLCLEIKEIWNKLEEIEQKLERISRTSKEDVDAIASDVFNLKQKIEFLESQVKEMQKA